MNEVNESHTPSFDSLLPALAQHFPLFDHHYSRSHVAFPCSVLEHTPGVACWQVQGVLPRPRSDGRRSRVGVACASAEEHGKLTRLASHFGTINIDRHILSSVSPLSTAFNNANLSSFIVNKSGTWSEVRVSWSRSLGKLSLARPTPVNRRRSAHLGRQTRPAYFPCTTRNLCVAHGAFTELLEFVDDHFAQLHVFGISGGSFRARNLCAGPVPQHNVSLE